MIFRLIRPKWLRRTVRILIYFILAVNLFIIISGKFYLYKAIWYNFANIDDYKAFDNADIRVAEGVPFKKSKSFSTNKISSELKETLERLKSTAFVVIKDGKIWYEQYWDDYGPDSYSGSFSVAKSYVATLIGIARDEGKIKSLDQSVSEFVPSFKEGGKEKVTIRHLLQMSSGLDWNESYMNPLSVTTEAYYGSDLRSLIDDQELVEEPGKEWKYLSGNTQVLAYVLESATGMKCEKYMEQKLWKPLGSIHPALWSTDDEGGDVKAYCCLNSNARDFSRLGLLYLNNGKFNGKRLLSKKWIEEATAPNLIPFGGSKTIHYGLHWWILDEEMYYARGILGQYIMVFPEKNMVVVRLGHKRGSKGESVHPEEVHAISNWVKQSF